MHYPPSHPIVPYCIFRRSFLGALAALGLLQAWFVAQAADGDFSPPLLTVSSHVNGQIVNTKTIVLSGTATDAGRGGHGISSVYARGEVAGATAVGSDTVNWSQSITLYPGANYIEVDAYDNSDQKNLTRGQLPFHFRLRQ
jgi:hypothetical protein